LEARGAIADRDQAEDRQDGEENSGHRSPFVIAGLVPATHRAANPPGQDKLNPDASHTFAYEKICRVRRSEDAIAPPTPKHRLLLDGYRVAGMRWHPVAHGKGCDGLAILQITENKRNNFAISSNAHLPLLINRPSYVSALAVLVSDGIVDGRENNNYDS
jgi:hypothetical protein